MAVLTRPLSAVATAVWLRRGAGGPEVDVAAAQRQIDTGAVALKCRIEESRAGHDAGEDTRWPPPARA